MLFIISEVVPSKMTAFFNISSMQISRKNTEFSGRHSRNVIELTGIQGIKSFNQDEVRQTAKHKAKSWTIQDFRPMSSDFCWQKNI